MTTIYQVVKQSADSNSVVIELNAKVLTSTFKNKECIQLADIYTYDGTQCKCPKEIVSHGTCAPIMGIFVKTIQIQF